MDSTVRQKHRRVSDSNTTIPANQPILPLDVLLALDRMLVEVSMQLYKVDRRDRSRVRRQNRRLHTLMREHLPC